MATLDTAGLERNNRDNSNWLAMAILAGNICVCRLLYGLYESALDGGYGFSWMLFLGMISLLKTIPPSEFFQSYGLSSTINL
jgi:hypothetical protein